MMDDEDLRLRLGRQAALDARRYQVDTVMKEWDTLFRSLVKRKTDS
jgi:hypothetical protein